MRLKNKKTGEIKNVETFGDNFLIEAKDYPNDTTIVVKSLSELNEEWEDVPEEPKNPCFINWFGEVSELSGHISDREIEKLKEAGNYFETNEEAEKAMEKLKAWKRLRDKGFEIYSWDYEFDMVDKPAQTIILKATAVDANNDLDLLFGGEE